MGIRSLPLQVRFLAGESTGSYVTRLAARNGLRVGQLLDSVGDGLSAAEVDPRYTELYLNAQARDRLAALTGRPLMELTTALPSLGDEHLLPGRQDRPVWKWPWGPHSGYLVRGCALCAASRDISTPVWLMCPDPWHICVRHSRFSDNSRDDTAPFIDLAPGPQVVLAERRRLLLVRRLGSVGRTLVADAFGVLAHESTYLPRLGTHRSTPLRLLPTAVKAACLMASAERRRLEHRLSPDGYKRWLDTAETAVGQRITTVLREWRSQHPLLRGKPNLPDPRSTRLALAHPHEQIGGMQSVDEISCLPWPVLASTERPYG
ncbi:TniQ family protein [Streptomyces sp. NBC_01180]|uniref:TniQ family protein n=1 Tax=Streptomyces sp. NBC_01180 TaxID=2903763 RepID=UPI00386A7074|nr:TniQ family protein [Streptomyces sp. NBC_01180]